MAFGAWLKAGVPIVRQFNRGGVVEVVESSVSGEIPMDSVLEGVGLRKERLEIAMHVDSSGFDDKSREEGKFERVDESENSGGDSNLNFFKFSSQRMEACKSNLITRT
ncbi:hypothetical protein Q3G72_015730 [Acer saccharum]|nr:hypothetical protein Q3G72_015730 [Acer saccharum]